MLRRLLVMATLVAALSAAAPVAAGAKGKPAKSSYGSTTLTVDSGTLEALGSLGVTPGAVAPASLEGATYSFPITNPLRNALRTGVVRHAGGISLSAGATTVALTDFDINLRQRTLFGKVNGARPVRFSTSTSPSRRVKIRNGRLVFGPVETDLTQGEADALNAAFGVSAFTDDTVLGDAKIRYRQFPF